VFDRLSIDLDPEDVARVAPTVVWATGQRFTSNDEARRWREAGATVVEVDSGLPQVEEPDRVAQIVAAQDGSSLVSVSGHGEAEPAHR
jgi:hypothetical protein